MYVRLLAAPGQIIREQYATSEELRQRHRYAQRLLAAFRRRNCTRRRRTSFSQRARMPTGKRIDMVRSRRYARDSCSECVAPDGKRLLSGDPA